MTEDEIRQILEQVDPENKVPKDIAEEFIVALTKVKTMDNENVEDNIILNNLQEQIRKETDWKKKASLAAKIISLGLN